MCVGTNDKEKLVSVHFVWFFLHNLTDVIMLHNHVHCYVSPSCLTLHHPGLFLLRWHHSSSSSGSREWAGPGHGWDGDGGHCLPAQAQRGSYQHCCHFLPMCFSWLWLANATIQTMKCWRTQSELCYFSLTRDLLYFGTGPPLHETLYYCLIVIF